MWLTILLMITRALFGEIIQEVSSIADITVTHTVAFVIRTFADRRNRVYWNRINITYTVYTDASRKL